MEEIRYGKWKRLKNRLKIAGILLLSAAVLFGGQQTWRSVLEGQAEEAAEQGKEKLPVLLGWIFRQYYPAGGSLSRESKKDSNEKNQKEWWIELIWKTIPLYRFGNKKEEIFTGGEDPAYKNYMNMKKAVTEYEALLDWGGEDTEEKESQGEESLKKAEEEGQVQEETSQNSILASAGGASGGTVYSIEQLADYDFMMSRFFSVHPSTTAGRDIMNARVFLEKDMSLTIRPEEPQILIYHTHSQETYADYGPENPDATVTGLGNCLAELLQAKGYQVIHDTTSYDLKGGKLDRSKAYTYALDGITEILQKHPSIEVILDIHRDGVKDGYHMVSQVDGKATAPVMFFLGMSRTPTEAIEYLPNPNLEGNLAFSFQMQLKAAEYFPGLTRKIYLKGLRYNLHLRPRSSLIEVGAQTNTYEEAQNAMAPLAEVLDMVLQGK